MGNLEGFAVGFTGDTFAGISLCPIDEVRVFARWISASPMLAPAFDDFLGGRGGMAACDWALARETVTAVAT